MFELIYLEDDSSLKISKKVHWSESQSVNRKKDKKKKSNKNK